ncbi:MAG: hypothetical protein KTR18_10645 [Acidiferrobacterales bacterium]|nr:hypothetical protein [Acidiferrobacterales bacterium]
MKNTLMTLATVLLFAASATAFSSGTESYGTAYKTKKVDQLYEKGKASYYAKDTNGQRLRYCVKTDENVQKVSRKSLKTFAGTSETELTNNLVSCDSPDSKITSIVDSEQVSAMVYYLNKRYRLNLYGS